MPKKQNTELPSVDSTALSVVHAEPEAEPPSVENRLVEVPQCELAAGQYISDYVHLRLSAGQAKTLAQLFVALNTQHAQLSDGKHIDSRTDALRWLLEAVEKAGDA